MTNREAAGSTPARGSTWHYIVVRKELSGGALLAQVAHAAGESANRHAGALDPETRVVVLSATKEQLAQLVEQLEKPTQTATSATTRILETDGPLTGSVTAVGVITSMREALKLQVPILGELKPWRDKVVASPPAAGGST